MSESKAFQQLSAFLKTLPSEGTPLRAMVDALLKEHRKIKVQLGKITRIGDGYQEQLQALNRELKNSNERLSKTLAEVKILQGFIPVCARCKRIRDDHGVWEQIEDYFSKHSEAVFSHSICPECSAFLYPGIVRNLKPTAMDGTTEGAKALPDDAAALDLFLEALARQPGNQGHPLLGAVSLLGKEQMQLQRQLAKITRISDGFQNQLRDLNIALKNVSETDSLTGLPNRRAMMARLNAETARTTRRGREMAVIMLDVDHFKRVNDTWGHDVGDIVLQTIGKAIRQALREYDSCARWGGEEFLVLLPETDAHAAEIVAQRIVANVAGTPVSLEDQVLTMTLSAGIAVRRTDEALNVLLQRADEALYRAKDSGRNQAKMAP
jgi:diguanylate cyclase